MYDANGVPVAASLNAANPHYVTELMGLREGVAPIGLHQRLRARTVLAGCAYASGAHRSELRMRGVTARFARPGTGLGRDRWMIERTFSWSNKQRRHARRYDRRSDIHEPIFTVGCRLISQQRVMKLGCI